MATTTKLKGEVVHVSRERKMFQGKPRIYVTIGDVDGERHSLPVSPKQADRFDMADLLQVGKKVYVEVEYFSKGEKWKDAKGKEETYKNDGRKIVRMTSLSSFDLKAINVKSAKTILTDTEDDLVAHMATVLAGMK